MNANIVNLLDQAANRYGVDPNLAVAVAQQESGGNPNAVSSAGAQGVMQLMPATAAALGVTNPFDPAQNIDAGVRFLSQLFSEFGGDVELALAAYNWGPGNVQKYGYSNWPAETVNYVTKILHSIGAAFATPDTAPASAPAAPGSTPATVDLIPMDSGQDLMNVTVPAAPSGPSNALVLGALATLAVIAWAVS